MNNRIKIILDTVKCNKEVMCTEDYLLEIFQDDYNPLKGETPRSAMENWLSKCRAMLNLDWATSFSDNGLVYYFRNIEKLPLLKRIDNEIASIRKQIAKTKWWQVIKRRKLKADIEYIYTIYNIK